MPGGKKRPGKHAGRENSGEKACRKGREYAIYLRHRLYLV